jgi:predicted transcriptional regulator
VEIFWSIIVEKIFDDLFVLVAILPLILLVAAIFRFIFGKSKKEKNEGHRLNKEENHVNSPAVLDFLTFSGANTRVNKIGCERIINDLKDKKISDEEAYDRLIEYGLYSNNAIKIIEHFGKDSFEKEDSTETNVKETKKDKSNDMDNRPTIEKVILKISENKKILTLTEIVKETNMEVEDIIAALEKLCSIGLVKQVKLENGKTIYDFS